MEARVDWSRGFSVNPFISIFDATPCESRLLLILFSIADSCHIASYSVLPPKHGTTNTTVSSSYPRPSICLQSRAYTLVFSSLRSLPLLCSLPQPPEESDQDRVSVSVMSSIPEGVDPFTLLPPIDDYNLVGITVATLIYGESLSILSHHHRCLATHVTRTQERSAPSE